ncbi:glycosyltransferase family 2 protein [Microbulbifer variabilis]|uniref:glycosyltransferase family 2 protein n=1 Tax=Microbulbifer variabilis TaxID=266805 RepID=UPI000368AA80|nr:glycosyltransferase family 2 protein [Microbulbifer variabilis]
MRPLLDICICTCKRPEQLRVALQSLAELDLPADADVSVTVVDNDPEEQGGKAVVESFATDSSLPILYVLEERRGIPIARNRCIQEAQGKNADYLIFIDDDEWVARDWLVKLFRFAQELGGNTVVNGSVIRELPDSVPTYYSRYFSRRKRQTGDHLTYCATNNVLIPMKIIREFSLSFDERDPFGGGEDVLFFSELHTKGGDIIHCAEAKVFEPVPISRANLRWLSRRKYSAGITLAKQKLQSGRSRLGILLSAIFQLMVAGVLCLFGLVFGGLRLGSRPWLRLCRSVGMACGVFGARSDFYRVVDC